MNNAADLRFTPLQLFLDSLRPPIEAQRLAEFAAQHPCTRLLEIGCGRGYISYALAARGRIGERIIAVDTAWPAVNYAAKPYEDYCSLAEKTSPIAFVCGDIRAGLFQTTAFDFIVCNPPFFQHQKSRPAHRPPRRYARSDVTLTLRDLFHVSAQLLTPNGALVLVFPYDRWDELVLCAAQFSFCLCTSKHHPEILRRHGGIMTAKFARNSLWGSELRKIE